MDGTEKLLEEIKKKDREAKKELEKQAKEDLARLESKIYTDRFDVRCMDGDYITYVSNSGNIEMAYVTILPDGECVFSKVYSESWLCPGEYLDCPGYCRGLVMSRETYTFEELDAISHTIVCLKQLNIKEVHANYRIW